MMKVKELSKLTGISVRTLHHYDAIGLLRPAKLTEAGYRLYSHENVVTLQQILFFRELGFPLKQIKEILETPSFNRREALEIQRNMLLEKRAQLDNMILTIEKTIQDDKGVYQMTNEERFTGFNFSENLYEEEARERWGNQAVEESTEKVSQIGTDFEGKMNRIYFKLAALRHLAPESKEAQEGIDDWFKLLNEMGSYSLEAFKGLGEMYVADERFTRNIDQFGEGLARFMCDAMDIYTQKRK